MQIRLQKYLADAGIASRRKAEEFIVAGHVRVNGIVITELGTKVDDEKDEILYNGKKISIEKDIVYIMLHKPEGYVTTVKDQFDRPTVIDLIKNVKERVFPIGRLDFDTSGLLLLTNDGDLTYKLTHPKHDIDKIYEAKIYGTPDINDMNQFRRGVHIDGRRTEPARLEIIRSDDRFSYVKITITEGRNRQVRNMCDAIKHPVASLKRIGTGELSIGDLEKGKFRHLTETELKYLKSL